VFPFVTLPASPASAVGGVLFDRLYRTASLPASMPLLAGLSVWGLVSAFRRRPPHRVARTRLLLLAAGSAGAALMIWGYIGPRYLADFLPFLAIGATVGLADVWRRQDGKTRAARVLATAIVAVVALYSMVANIGIAVTPTEQWTQAQTLRYLQVQHDVSSWAGNQLAGRVTHGATLPTYAPAGQIRIVGDCDALYLSNGENYAADPKTLFHKDTWQVVQYGPALQRQFTVTPHQVTGTAYVPLVVAGDWTISVVTTPRPAGGLLLHFTMSGSGRHAGTDFQSFVAGTPVGGTHRVTVLTDPNKRSAQVWVDGVLYLDEPLVDGTPISTAAPESDALAPGPITVVDDTASLPQPTLCRQLLRGG
jgi:hypothetical protein